MQPSTSYVPATQKSVSRILIVGDIFGIPQLLRHVPAGFICGYVAASIRPQYLDRLVAIAKKACLPLLVQPRRQDDSYKSFVDSVAALKPDLIWVHSYSMILGSELLSLPKYGGVNIHASPLPRYRGCNPTEWAIIRGEKETGVTLHELTPGIDEGPIIDQRIVPLFQEDTWKMAARRIWRTTDELIEKNVTKLIGGTWKSVPQNERLSSYFPRRKDIHGQFSWNDKIKNIYNLIRALVAPHPGASYMARDGSIARIRRYKSLHELTFLKQQMHASVGLIGTTYSLSVSPPQTATCKLFRPQRKKSKARYACGLSSRHKTHTKAVYSKQLANNIITFSVKTNTSDTHLGKCCLYNINLNDHTAACYFAVKSGNTKMYQELRSLVKTFALDQLECDIIFHD